MITLSIFIGFFVILNVLYLLVLRPGFRKWNSTFEEVNMKFPGDKVISDYRTGSTRAIEINASPEEIWNELIQVKKKRPDVYNYNWIENLLNYKFIRRNKYLRFLRKRLSSNKFVIFKPSESTSVYAEQAQKYLIFRDIDKRGNQYCWIFYLKKEETSTRLLIRSVYKYKPGFLNYIIWEYISEPVYYIVEKRMLKAVRKQVETAINFR